MSSGRGLARGRNNEEGKYGKGGRDKSLKDRKEGLSSCREGKPRNLKGGKTQVAKGTHAI